MDIESQHQPEEKQPTKLSDSVGGLKADFEAIKLILLTAAVVLILLTVAFIFILRSFVTFDALDRYLSLTQNVRPKILHNISEELDSGYSRDFFIRSGSGDVSKTDNTMLFYATRGQRVSLIAQATEISGVFSPVTFQIDGCSIDHQWDEPFSLLDFDLSKQLGQCSSDQPNVHTLRVVLPKGSTKGSNMEIKCLVVVYHRVHEHIE